MEFLFTPILVSSLAMSIKHVKSYVCSLVKWTEAWQWMCSIVGNPGWGKFPKVLKVSDSRSDFPEPLGYIDLIARLLKAG